MDGIISAHSLPNNLVGVLFAEDFDLPFDPAATTPAAEPVAAVPEPAEPPSGVPVEAIPEPPPEPCEPEIIIPTYSAEELEAARCEGHERGRQEGQQAARGERDEMIRLLLEKIVKQFEQAAADATRVAEGDSEATALLLVQCLASLLPALCARHGAAEALAVAACILPSLKREPRVGVRVHPASLADMQSAIARLDSDYAGRIEVLAMDALATGDVRINWQDGEAVRDAGAMLGHVLQILAVLNVSTDEPSPEPSPPGGTGDQALQQPATAEREMAYGG
jgi:hypothetical protein